MEYPWFNSPAALRRGDSFKTKFGFFPASPVGWVIFIATAAFCIFLFFDINSQSHSISDTLISWLINVAIVNVLYSVFAFLSSRKSKL